MAVACFQLKHQSASFEFFLWLVLVKAMGATKVVIDPSSPKLKWYSQKGLNRRIDNILLPGAALAGLYCKIGTYSPNMMIARAPDLLAWVRAGKTFERLKATKKPEDVARYTVTLRRNEMAPARNSNEEAWRTFARQIGAYVIEDYVDQPIHLHDRMALYSEAEMNFGVSNGPLAMIGFTDYPMIMFVPKGSAASATVKSGVPWGGKYPWMLSNQNMIWEQDNLENLRACYKYMAVGR